MVEIDARSAHRLVGEGALTYETDTNQTSRDGKPCPLPSPSDPITHPILVIGTDQARVLNTAHTLESLGLPAWRVVPNADMRTTTRSRSKTNTVNGTPAAPVAR
jgi:hypothetical protein